MHLSITVIWEAFFELAGSTTTECALNAKFWIEKSLTQDQKNQTWDIFL